MRRENKFRKDIKKIISNEFKSKFVNNLIDNFYSAVQSFEALDDEKTILKSAKFIEALSKILLEYTNQYVPPKRSFKPIQILKSFARLPRGSHDDILRITIPRLSIFIYDVASNRGGRHDPFDIDVNKVDASFLLNGISWILAELVRYSFNGDITVEEAKFLVESIFKKRIRFFEEIDGRIYINLPKKLFKKLSCRDIGVLILYYVYPKRIVKNTLSIQLKKHGFKKDNIVKSVQRLESLVDENENGLLLRGIGRKEAETILFKISRNYKN